MESTDLEPPDQSFLEQREDRVAEVDTLSTNLESTHVDRENEETDEEDSRRRSPDPLSLGLNEELQAGYKILTGLMAWSLKHVNWPFMESIETTDPELYESYKEKIQKPMWLKLMKEKFEEHVYTSITEFVADFRLMLENCYHFNGPDHFVSKRAVKLETMLEQKLALLSRDIREKTTIAATSGQKDDDVSSLGLRRRTKTIVPHNSTLLMNQLREEQIQKKKERRRKMIMDRRAEREALAQEITSWEEEVLFAGKKDQMRAMWEIPQIGLFLFLLQDPLNVGEVMHFELERCFMMPRESTTMHRIMTSLLSTPFQRLKIDKKNVMPYRVWEGKLRYKLQVWYKIFHDCSQDVSKTCNKLGLEDKFFDIVGHQNPLEKRRYHELRFYKKVWIMKALCDHCMHMQETLRDMIELQPFEDQRELVLGTDGQGQRYIHFPQFCGADVRVYRQAPFKYPKIEIKPDPFDSKRKFPFVYKPPPRKKVKLKKIKRPPPSPVKPVQPSPSASPLRQRPSRLRQAPKSVTPLQLLDDVSVTETNSSSDSDNNMDDASAVEELEAVPGPSGISSRPVPASDLSDREPDDTETKSDGHASSGSDATLPYCDNSDTNSNVSSRDVSRDSSPYPACPDLSKRRDSNTNRSSDVSQESSPCISPADFIPRRSARLDKGNSASRDTSPLIFDADFGLRRGRRRGTALKNMPPYNAARDLTSFFDDNSCSNSSAGGDNSLTGPGTSFWREKLGTSRQSSCETGDESNFCDISKLFSNSKAADSMTSAADSESIDENKEEKMDIGNESNSGKPVNDVIDKKLKSDFSDQGDGKDSVEDMDTSMSNDNEKSQPDCSENMINSSKHKTDHENNDPLSAKVDPLNSVVLSGRRSGPTEKEVDHCEMASNTEEDITKLINLDCKLPRSISGNFVVSTSDKCDVDNEFTPGDNEMSDLTQNSAVKASIKKNIDEISEEKVNVKFDNMEVESGKSERNTGDQCNTEDHIQKEEGVTDDTSVKSEDKVFHIKSENCVEYDVNENSKSEPEVKELKTEHGMDPNLDEKLNVKSETITETKEVSSKSSYLDNEDKTDLKKDIEGVSADSTRKVQNTLSSAVKQETMKMEVSVKSENGGKDKKVKSEDQKPEESKSEDEEDDEEEVLPDAKQFYLVADSVAELRRLAESFAEPEPIVLRRGKKEIVQKMPPRKKNVVELHERLMCLLKELEPWEHKLSQATRNARIRLRREVEDYEEPPGEKEDCWNTTDEETESGESDGEKGGSEDTGKSKPLSKPSSTADTNSRSSTPVKAVDDIEEIDISQRGRLRKRRIIPNNVEDQYASKKPRQIAKSDSTPSSSEAVIVQQSKTELVEYADIIRQLQNSTGIKPLLIKSNRGGRTVLTSVMPVGSAASDGSNKSSAPTGIVQSLHFATPLSTRTSMPGSILTPPVSEQADHPNSAKVSQHPTIRTLLSASLSAASNKALGPLNTAVFISSKAAPLAVSSTDGSVRTSPQFVAASLVTSPQSAMLTSTSIPPGQTTPQKIPPNGQIMPGKVLTASAAVQTGLTNPSVAAMTVVSSAMLSRLATSGPRKIAPRNNTKVATTAGSVPVTALSQLMTSKASNSTQGKKNILLIPVDNDKQLVNVVPLKQNPVTPVKVAPGTSSSAPNEQTPSQQSPVHDNSVSSATVGSKSPNQLILPKPQIATGVQRIPLQQGILGLQGAIVTQGVLQQGVLGGLNGSLNKLAHTASTSPPRYPSNETVRTLLDKRKCTEDKNPPYKFMKFFLNKTSSNEPVTVTLPIMSNTASVTTTVKLSSETTLSASTKSVVTPSKALQAATPNKTLQVVMSVPNPVPSGDKSDSAVTSVKTQQCVITSISPAKLNTLLLQTNAAGAKSIPSLIKLPSKAALDSAMKAVLTSVSTTLPTVNIKVPSPTSLPNIGPRRNVTKTIQTMKSPIPVAPKVVTQNSGGKTSLSMANSSTVSNSQLLVVPSMQGQAVQGQMLTLQCQASVSEGPGVVPALKGQSSVVQGSLAAVQGQTALIQSGMQGQAALVQGPVTALQGQGSTVHVNKSAIPAQSTLNKPANTAQGTESVTSSGQACVVVNKDGQKVFTKITPHLLITSKGMMQVGYMSQDGVLLGGKTSTETSVMSAGKSTVAAPGAANTQSDTSKPVIALNASGIPICSLRRSSVGPTNFVVSSVVSGSTEQSRPQLVQSYIMPQSATGQLNPVQSPVIGQPNIVSPLIGVNLQTGLALPGGVQLASPLSLQLLQSPLGTVQTQQTTGLNRGLLQTATTQTLTNQLVTPLMVKTGTPNLGLLQKVNNKVSASGSQIPITNLQSLTSALQMYAASPGLPVSASQLNLTSPIGSATKQLVFQYPSAGQQLAAVTSQFLQSQVTAASNTPTPDGKLLLSVMGTKTTVQTSPVQSHAHVSAVNNTQNSLSSTSVNIHPIQIPSTVSPRSSPVCSSSQQKLLLFSIGGQLVTGQGVPVTLSNGVLKVLPQGKVKINNQTLTQEQVKQTLAKINEAAASLSVTSARNAMLSNTAVIGAAGASNTAQVQNSSDQKTNKNTVVGVTNVSVGVVQSKLLVNGKGVSSGDHDYQVKKEPGVANLTSVPVKQLLDQKNMLIKVKNEPESLSVKSPESFKTVKTFSLPLDQMNQSSASISLNIASVVPGNMETSMGYSKVLLDHNKVPFKIENHSAAGEKLATGNTVFCVKKESAGSSLSEHAVQGRGHIDMKNEDTDSADSFCSDSMDSGRNIQSFDHNKYTSEKQYLQRIGTCIGSPILQTDSSGIGKLLQRLDTSDKTYIVRAPVKVGGIGDAASAQTSGIKMGTVSKTEEVEDDNKLIIDDDCGSEKEAALNLLTLANQALQPLSIKEERRTDVSDSGKP